MYEERLKEIGKQFGIINSEFYILKNKKREIYFKNTPEAIEFIKNKFESSLFKRFAYFLIKNKTIYPFLDKIILPKEFGDVIFIANRIKCFNLQKKEVLVFDITKERENKFREVLMIREKYLKNYAPDLLEVNYRVPYFKEELLEQYTGDYGIVEYKLKSLNRETGLVHGDLVKEHILAKEGSCVFIDWENVSKGEIKE